ncbi:MAG: DUF5677 domain-containing protein [Francisellaceae bacterium]
MEELQQLINHIEDQLKKRQSNDALILFFRECLHIIKAISLLKRNLSQQEQNSAIPILTRTVFEYHINSTILIKDSHYIHTLIYQDNQELLKFQNELPEEYRTSESQQAKEKVEQDIRKAEKQQPFYTKKFKHSIPGKLHYIDQLQSNSDNIKDGFYAVYRLLSRYTHAKINNDSSIAESCCSFAKKVLNDMLDYLQHAQV